MNLSPEHLISLARSIGWMLLHSLWQGAVIAVILFLFLRLLRAHGAAVRHLACLWAMLLVAGWAAGTVVHSSLGHSALARGQTSHAVAPRAEWPLSWWPSGAGAAAAGPIAKSSAAFAMATQTLSRAERLLPACAVVWLLGVVCLSLRRVYAWRILGGWRRRASVADSAVGALWSRLLGRCGIAGGLALGQTEEVASVVLVGLWRPMVLFPLRVATGLRTGELEALLAHEVSHFIRHDPWANHLQMLLETLFFYHPAVWWMSRLARQERELAADDLAVELCADRRLYAEALGHLAELSWQPRLALAASGGDLSARIRRLLKPDPVGVPTSGWCLGGPVLVCLVSFILLLHVQGQAPTPEEPGQSSPGSSGPVLGNEGYTRTRIRQITDVAAAAPAVAASPLAGQADLQARLVALEKKAAEEEAKKKQEEELVARVEKNRQLARVRAQLDRQRYDADQLREIETLYQVANTKGKRTEEARASLEQLLAKYDSANRTGCALLYLGQASEGAKRLEYLTRAVEKFSDCYYFNGCQVGGYGRYVLALTLWEQGEKDKARALLQEIKAKYPGATDHQGRLMSEDVLEVEKELAKQP